MNLLQIQHNVLKSYQNHLKQNTAINAAFYYLNHSDSPTCNEKPFVLPSAKQNTSLSMIETGSGHVYASVKQQASDVRPHSAQFWYWMFKLQTMSHTQRVTCLINSNEISRKLTFVNSIRCRIILYI